MNQLYFLVTMFSFISIASCKNKQQTDKAKSLTWFESMPFGTVQPALEANAPGEEIKRIDSLVQGDSAYTIHYVTNKGVRLYHSKGRLSTLVIKGYKADGGHSCVGASSYDHKTVSYCYDSACTIVIDSIRLDRKLTPYPILHPEKDSVYTACPTIKH